MKTIFNIPVDDELLTCAFFIKGEMYSMAFTKNENIDSIVETFRLSLEKVKPVENSPIKKRP